MFAYVSLQHPSNDTCLLTMIHTHTHAHFFAAWWGKLGRAFAAAWEQLSRHQPAERVSPPRTCFRYMGVGEKFWDVAHAFTVECLRDAP